MKSVVILLICVFSLTSCEIRARIGVESYLYSFPLVVMAETQNMITNDGKVDNLNKLLHITELATPEEKGVVRPNVDTLYTAAWLDLSSKPQVLTVPDSENRYYIHQFMDAWTNVFASIGKRTTGTGAGKFVICGPHFNGTIDDPTLNRIDSPTNMVFLLGRIQTDGESDVENVKALQNKFFLNPLNEGYPGDFIKFNTTRIPINEVKKMDVVKYFSTFSEWLNKNDPAKADAATIENLKYFEIFQGKKFDYNSLSLWERINLKTSYQLSNYFVFNLFNTYIKMQQSKGWALKLNVGTYGTDYITRAGVALIGLGCNLPADAVYPTTYVDSKGNQLNGKSAYKLHFNKEELPPVNAFWSLTLYNSDSFLVPNKANKYAIRDRDNLVYNQDGSLDIYIQPNSPGEALEGNWLPSPVNEDFNLSLRLYWPKQIVLDGKWVPPSIQKSKSSLK